MYPKSYNWPTKIEFNKSLRTSYEFRVKRWEVEIQPVWLTLRREPCAIWMEVKLDARDVGRKMEVFDIIWFEHVEYKSQINLPNGPKMMETKWIIV